MELTMRNASPLYALFLAASLMACATFGLPGPDIQLISQAEEEAIGEQVHQQVIREYKVVDDPALTGYLEELGARLVENVPDSEPGDFEFFVILNPSINAMAAPGGRIYINSGLILSAQSESELAAVMAHEMGHVTERHGVQQLQRALGLNILAALALGREPGLLHQLVAQVGGTALLLNYSRGAEREADERAIEYMYAADKDPRGLIRFFERLQEEHGETPRALVWLQSHPLTSNRILDAQRQIGQLAEKRVLVNHPRFHEYQQRVAQASERFATPHQEWLEDAAFFPNAVRTPVVPE
jgi:beta-barrel assembly-enhancing protease